VRGDLRLGEADGTVIYVRREGGSAVMTVEEVAASKAHADVLETWAV
jgi:hypothetical protein